MADSTLKMKTLLAGLMKKDFTSAMKRERQTHLQSIYMHENNIKRLIELIA